VQQVALRILGAERRGRDEREDGREDGRAPETRWRSSPAWEGGGGGGGVGGGRGGRGGHGRRGRGEGRDGGAARDGGNKSAQFLAVRPQRETTLRGRVREICGRAGGR
jgi:hypothetical protein